MPTPIPIPIISTWSVHPEDSPVKYTNAYLSYDPDSSQSRSSTHAPFQTTKDLSLVYRYSTANVTNLSGGLRHT